LCADCGKPHFTKKALKKHHLQTVEEHAASGGGGGGGGESICGVHGKVFEYFCKTHFALLCSKCAVLGHPKGSEHDVRDIGEVGGEVKEVLEQLSAGELTRQI
jgi:hypothetical protein